VLIFTPEWWLQLPNIARVWDIYFFSLSQRLKTRQNKMTKKKGKYGSKGGVRERKIGNEKFSWYKENYEHAAGGKHPSGIQYTAILK
jgi:hypothetical protein